MELEAKQGLRDGERPFRDHKQVLMYPACAFRDVAKEAESTAMARHTGITLTNITYSKT